MREDPLPYLTQLPMFEGFTKAELDMLATVFTVRKLKPAEVLAKEGSPAPCFFIVVTGIVSVFKEVGQDKRQRLATIGKNCLLGEISLIDGGRRSASLEAGSPCILLECSREDFERLFKANNPFAYKVLDFIILDLSKRLRQANRRLEELLADPARTLSMIYDAFVEVGRTVHETGEFPRTNLR